MVRAMCGRRVIDKKITQVQVDMLELKETVDGLEKENRVRCYGHMLGRNDDSALRVPKDVEVSDKRKRGQPRKTWKKQVKEEGSLV